MVVRRRDDFEDSHNPDGLNADEREALALPFYRNASDADICREADLGNPVADEVFHSWPVARREAAARLVDAEDC